MSLEDSLKKDKIIWVAGHQGLVGSAIMRAFKHQGYTNLHGQPRSVVDLSDSSQVERYFSELRPQWVVIAAAKVGGIHANSTYPVDFLLENLKIQNNLLELSYKYSVEKLLFLGSSCIYPRNAPQPLKEEYLLTAALEPTNQWYALAKIAGIKLCQAYVQQYQCNFLAAMPCNLYGLNDNYHAENSHVIPGLIRRFHAAKISGQGEVVVWGSGAPIRELMNADDLASASVFMMEECDSSCLQPYGFINVGSGQEYTIKEIATLICEVVGFDGEIRYDLSRPDGTPRKVLDSSRIHGWGWRARIDLRSGLIAAYQDYLLTGPLKW